MRRPKKGWAAIPGVRNALVGLGFLMIATTPLVGPIPGPGGIFWFAGGLSLVLKYTGWAKRLYVRFKRKHPKKGSWADWSLRRASARRRHERQRQWDADAARAAADAAISVPMEIESPAPAQHPSARARAPMAGQMDRPD